MADIHTAEPIVPEPSAFEVELAIDKLKSHKSPGIDRIPAQLIKVGGRTMRSDIHKLRNVKLLILFGITTNCLRIGRSRSLYLSIRRAIKQTVLTLRRLMSYIYGASILDVSRSHTTTQHSR